jgi:hypothetical protein
MHLINIHLAPRNLDCAVAILPRSKDQVPTACTSGHCSYHRYETTRYYWISPSKIWLGEIYVGFLLLFLNHTNHRFTWDDGLHVPIRADTVDTRNVLILLCTIQSFLHTFQNHTRQTHQNVSFSNWSLDVSHNGTASTFGIHKFHTDLSDITRVSSPSKDAIDFGKLDRLILTSFSKRGKCVRTGARSEMLKQSSLFHHYISKHTFFR